MTSVKLTVEDVEGKIVKKTHNLGKRFTLIVNYVEKSVDEKFEM